MSKRVVALASALMFGFYVYRRELVHPFWDMAVYAGAIDACRLGKSAYAQTDTFLFVYPPVFLRIFCVMPAWGMVSMLLVLYAAALIWLFRQMRRIGPLAAQEGLFAFMLVGFAGFASLLSGNITAFGHLAIAAGFMSGLAHSRRNHGSGDLTRRPTLRGFGMGLMLALLGATKPYFLAYVLVPLCMERSWPALRFAVLVPVVSGAVLLLDYLVDPVTFNAFLLALKTQTVERGDLGLSIASVLAWRGYAVTGMAVHFAAWLALMLVGLAATRGGGRELVLNRLLFLLAGSILLNPRFKEYDYAPLMLIATMGLVRSLPWRAYLLANALVLLVANMSWILGAGSRALFRLGMATATVTPLPYAYLTCAAYLMFVLLAWAPLRAPRRGQRHVPDDEIHTSESLRRAA